MLLSQSLNTGRKLKTGNVPGKLTKSFHIPLYTIWIFDMSDDILSLAIICDHLKLFVHICAMILIEPRRAQKSHTTYIGRSQPPRFHLDFFR